MQKWIPVECDQKPPFLMLSEPAGIPPDHSRHRFRRPITRKIKRQSILHPIHGVSPFSKNGDIVCLALPVAVASGSSEISDCRWQSRLILWREADSNGLPLETSFPHLCSCMKEA